jgi:hypothetical protein
MSKNPFMPEHEIPVTVGSNPYVQAKRLKTVVEFVPTKEMFTKASVLPVRTRPAGEFVQTKIVTDKNGMKVAVPV